MKLEARQVLLVLAWSTAACSSDSTASTFVGADAGAGGGQTAGMGGGGSAPTGAAGAAPAGSTATSTTGGLPGAGTGGSSAGAGLGGSSAGAESGGSPSLTEIAQTLDNMRLEDPCGDTPSANHTCQHLGSTADTDAFAAAKTATVGGTPGLSYRVKLRVRGATEGTHTQAGQSAVPMNFVVGGIPYARGTNEANYQYWRLAVDHPAQNYYLNSFDALGLAHVIHALDFEVSIPVAAGAHVRLELRDENGHEISNDTSVHPDGVAAAPESGQFVQLNVASVELATP